MFPLLFTDRTTADERRDVKPYYEADGITLYCGDAREVLPDLDLSAFGVVVADPPYSSGGFQEAGRSAGSIGTRTSETIANANLSTRGYERLLRETFRHLNHIDELYLFTDWRMWITSYDVTEAAGWRVRNMLVWDKMQMGMGMPWRNQHELIAFGKRNPGKIIDGKMGNVLRVARSGNVHHPTEKPHALIELLLSNSEASAVIDPFAGSGTTLVAAKNLARRALGIEITERHCETAATRLQQGVLNLGGAA